MFKGLDSFIINHTDSAFLFKPLASQIKQNLSIKLHFRYGEKLNFVAKNLYAMRKSLTIYTQDEVQLNKLKALMLTLDIPFKENEVPDKEIEIKKL